MRSSGDEDDDDDDDDPGLCNQEVLLQNRSAFFLRLFKQMRP
jgi:hypothetical protein